MSFAERCAGVIGDRRFIILGLEAVGNVVPFFVPNRAQFVLQLAFAAVSVSTLAYFGWVAFQRRKDRRSRVAPSSWRHWLTPLGLFLLILAAAFITEQVTQAYIGFPVGHFLLVAFACVVATVVAYRRRPNASTVAWAVCGLVALLVVAQVLENVVSPQFGGVVPGLVLVFVAFMLARLYRGNLLVRRPRSAWTVLAWLAVIVAFVVVEQVVQNLWGDSFGAMPGLVVAVVGGSLFGLLEFRKYSKRRRDGGKSSSDASA